jgi:hypothetical protein
VAMKNAGAAAVSVVPTSVDRLAPFNSASVIRPVVPGAVLGSGLGD